MLKNITMFNGVINPAAGQIIIKRYELNDLQ
jgi:hypothetical protein